MTADQKNNKSRAVLVLSGTMLLAFALGSVHAFSLLQPVIEQTFKTSRTSASLTYSIALIALALAVFLGYRAYSKFPPPVYVMGVGLMAALGCLIAGLGGSLPVVWFGFSLLFGGANGLGYGYALQFSAQAMPNRKGFAMGAVTAAYALIAIVLPVPLNAILKTGGWSTAMLFLSLGIFIISAISAALLSWSKMTYENSTGTTTALVNVNGRVIALLWLTYGCAVTAGLMAIGHATGIAEIAGVRDRWVVAAPIIIASANMVGSLLCGVLLDRLSGPLVLFALGVVSFSALTTMSILPQADIAMLGLALIGFAYGGTISVYPAFISNRFGSANGTIIYGKVFTAWAAAGLLGPVSAGVLFDHYQDYRLALAVAAAVALCSVALLACSFKQKPV